MVNPTGVGKHQCGMLKALAQRDDVDLELIVPVRDVSAEASTELLGLGCMNMKMMPWNARNLERMWNFTGWPGVDRECAGSDWIYSPFEAMPPVRSISRIATVHQMMWFDKTSPWYGEWARIRFAQRRLYDRMAGEAQGVMCVSEYLREKFIEAYPHAADRTHVVWNGAEEIYFEAGAAERAGKRDALIVIGPLTAAKGAPLLFELADKLAIYLPEKRIVVIGGKCSPLDMIEEARRHSNVELHNYLKPEQIVELMKNALLLLQVSATETFGIPAAEAMAAGLPVVAVKAMATEEVIGNAGILVDDGDGEGMRRAVAELASDQSAVKELRDKGRERAEMFRWGKCAARLIQVMEMCS